MTTVAQLAKRMDKLEQEMKRLRQVHADPDGILDEDDRRAIAAADEDARNDRLVSHTALKRKYGL